jgi:broad specificity phosphatase PhoE
VSVEIIFETHSTSTDNEAGIASGWRDPPLSALGRRQATELSRRHEVDVIDAVFCSDLRRATETAEIAFGDRTTITADPRLREYDYGAMTGEPPARIHAEIPKRVDTPFPEGESLSDVAGRVRSFLAGLARDWDGKRVVVIGHVATRLALEHLLGGRPLEEVAAAEFVWQPGWRYVLEG